MKSDRPWEDRVAYMMRRAGQRVRRERSVFVRAAIDFHLGIVSHNEFFGPLLPVLVGRRVVVEHHSRPPDSDAVERALLKALATQIRSASPTKTKRSAHGTVEPPVDVSLVVLCREGTGGCQRLPLVPHATESGWWTCYLARLQVHVVDSHLLNTDGRWGVLRFAMAVSTNPAAQVAELLGDPGASTLTKRRLLEAIMNKRVETTLPERRITYDSVFDRGRKAGRNEGREEGRRNALLAVAATLGLPVDELSAINDVVALERSVLDAVKALG